MKVKKEFFLLPLSFLFLLRHSPYFILLQLFLYMTCQIVSFVSMSFVAFLCAGKQTGIAVILICVFSLCCWLIVCPLGRTLHLLWTSFMSYFMGILWENIYEIEEICTCACPFWCRRSRVWHINLYFINIQVSLKNVINMSLIPRSWHTQWPPQHLLLTVS